MLAVSQGRLVCLSTPFGQRGRFFDEWQGKGPWRPPNSKLESRNPKHIRIPKFQTPCPRSLVWQFGFRASDLFRTSCFDFEFGGIDWGWRNPFAAVWGLLDNNDVLWIGDEVYRRETPLHELRKALPKPVQWYADPSGPTEINEFRRAGYVVRKGLNDIRLGIAAVTARIRTGRLRVCAHRCPNLLAEAKLYRYPSPAGKNLCDDPVFRLQVR